MRELIGKVVQKIFIDKEDQHYISFHTDKGVVNFVGYGDCCSETYFSDVNRIVNLVGRTVINVTEIENFEEEKISEQPSRQEEDQIYGVLLETDVGKSLIVYRNSSNGYYGGSSDFTTEIPSEIILEEITSDYTAPFKRD